GSNGSGNGQLNQPMGIAVDQLGNVWVADTINDRIEEFSNTGTYLRQFGGPGTGDGQFDRPEGVAIGQAGNVWVADANNSRIEEFTGTGVFIRKFSTLHPTGIAADAAGNIWMSSDQVFGAQEYSSLGTLLQQVGTQGTGSGQFSQGTWGVTVDGLGNLLISDTFTPRVEEFSPNVVHEPSTLALAALGAAALFLARRVGAHKKAPH